mgnify:CR=1 FL=1
MTLDQLQAELAALLDPLDIPRSWITRQLNDYEERRRILSARIAAYRAATSTLAEVDPQIAPLKKWHGHQVAWRKTLCDRLLALPARLRDPVQLALQQSLRLSIIRIDRGLDFMNDMLPANLPLDDLMREAGYVPRDPVARAHGEAWFGCLPDVERRLRDLQKRRDAAQADLDDALRDEPAAPKPGAGTWQIAGLCARRHVARRCARCIRHDELGRGGALDAAGVRRTTTTGLGSSRLAGGFACWPS